MKKLPIFTLATVALISTEAFSQSSNEQAEKNYYVAPKSYGANIESDKPNYVRQLDKTEFEAFKNLKWIDAGLQYRVRGENRENDIRRSGEVTDNPILSRTRAYFGIKNIADPFRFAVELQDSRLANSKFSGTNREVNRLEFLQSYGELYFENALGSERPLSVRAGRMTIDILDRKLFGRNEWRNTTNAFQGVRTVLGQRKNDWQADFFAVQPLDIHIDDTDSRNKNLRVYGATFDFRRWSDKVTLQPFYFKYDREASATTTAKNVNATGLRGYGLIGKSGFDYDLEAIYQFGNNNGQTQQSFGGVADLGYTFDHEWKPRASVQYLYAGGDKDPYDVNDDSFEGFYGVNSILSANDYIQFKNVTAIRPRFVVKPSKKLQIDSGYSFYSLASRKDAWSTTGLRDKTGESGTSLGQEFDIRTRYQILPNLGSEIGYSHFEAGEFIRSQNGIGSSDFVYLQLTVSLFK